MTRACRERCTGGPFDHQPVVMSIARATETVLRLRCPLCRREVEKTADGAGDVGTTPTPQGPRPPIQQRR